MIAGDGPPKNNVMNDQSLCFPAQQTTLAVAPPDERPNRVPSFAASADLASRPIWIKRPAASIHGIARPSACLQIGHCRRAERWSWRIQFRMFPAMFVIALLIAEKAARMGRLARIAFATVWASDGDLASAFAHNGTASLAAGEWLVNAFGIQLAEIPGEDGALFAAPFTGVDDRCSHLTSPACLSGAWLLGARGPESAPVG